MQVYKGSLAAQREQLASAPEEHRNNAPYIVSPRDVVDLMLEVGEVDADDVVYDLGCGDARILIVAATQFGCRGVGYEYDPQIAEMARQKVREAGVEHLVTIHQGDIFEIPRDELNQATVITLYLLDWMNKKLIPQLRELDEGKMIVSHDWGLDRIKPDRIENIQSEDDPQKKIHVVRAWRTPLNMEARE
ncbi:MAG: SAM-dependent methyltransferase [Pirellulaceae bacterium]